MKIFSFTLYTEHIIKINQNLSKMKFLKTLKRNYQMKIWFVKLIQAILKKYQINNKFLNRIVQVEFQWEVTILQTINHILELSKTHM